MSSPWPVWLVAARLPSTFCLKDCQVDASKNPLEPVTILPLWPHLQARRVVGLVLGPPQQRVETQVHMG